MVFSTMKYSAISLCFFFIFVKFSMAQTAEMPLRVAYTQWFPYTFEEKGISAGFEIEITRAVFKRMKVAAEYEIFPWQRCLVYLKQGRVDVLISLLKTPERVLYAYFPDEHVSVSKSVFFSTTDNRIRFNGNLEGLKGYTIGVVMGFSYGQAFDQADYLNREGAVDAAMLINKLLKKRTDLAAENQAVVRAIAQKMGVTNQIRFLDPPIHMEKLYVGFSKTGNLKQTCRLFSNTLHRFKKTEQYGQILKKYGIRPSDMQ